MTKDDIEKIIIDCTYPLDSLPDCEWELNEDEAKDKIIEAVIKEEKQLLLDFYEFIHSKRFDKCPAINYYSPDPLTKYATLYETDLKNDLEEFISNKLNGNDELKSKAIQICEYYHEIKTKREPTDFERGVYFGQAGKLLPDSYSITETTGRCWGTRECETCYCRGDKNKCTFYSKEDKND